MSRKEYVKANDWYFQLSIGNAAWPMGVTMVGIHERTGREKLESRHVARAYFQFLSCAVLCFRMGGRGESRVKGSGSVVRPDPPCLLTAATQMCSTMSGNASTSRPSSA